jgi:hypothetical protein
MKELNIPFSLFDFFAVLMPGAVGLFGIYLFVNPSLTLSGHNEAFSHNVFSQEIGDLALFTLLIISSYLFGHVLNALSEIIVDKPSNRIFGYHIREDIEHPSVKAALLKEFGDYTELQNKKRTFIMIETVVSKEFPDTAAQAKRYIATAVMFESLALSQILIGTAIIRGYLTGKIFQDMFIQFMFLVIFLVILILIMLFSYRRYKSMWSRNICMAFVAFSKPANYKGDA